MRLKEDWGDWDGEREDVNFRFRFFWVLVWSFLSVFGGRYVLPRGLFLLFRFLALYLYMDIFV